MTTQQRVLVVEDEAPMSILLERCLKLAGVSVFHAGDGPTGLKLALEQQPDLLVLDIDLPRMSGLEVCTRLRARSFIAPILMLTGKSLVEERVAGLNAGADDYLGKPFAADEFLARVNALLRRQNRAIARSATLRLGDATIDLVQKTARRGERPLHLTKTEYAILDLLASREGVPISRETILNVVWGYTRVPTTRTVDTHIWRLRQKIGDDGELPRWIKQVHGCGYCLSL